jgi:hypothetical protein
MLTREVVVGNVKDSRDRGVPAEHSSTYPAHTIGGQTIQKPGCLTEPVYAQNLTASRICYETSICYECDDTFMPHTL